MIVSTNKYNTKDFFKFMREASNATQEEFAKSIGKTKFWVRDIEQGKNKYYFDDLVELAKIYGFEIQLIKKK